MEEAFQQSLFGEAQQVKPASKKKPSKAKESRLSICDITIEFVEKLPYFDIGSRNILPSSSGIYFVSIRTVNTVILYIGVSDNINRRWIKHDQTDGLEYLFKIGIDVHISYLLLDWRREDMDLMESNLIRKFCPPLNFAHSQKPRVKKIREVDELTKQRIALSIPFQLENLEIFMLKAISRELGMAVTDSDTRSGLITSIKDVLGTVYKYKKGVKQDKEEKLREEIKLAKEEVIKMLLSNSQDGDLEGCLRSLRARPLKLISSTLKIYRYSHMTTEQMISEILAVLEKDYEGPQERRDFSKLQSYYSVKVISAD